MNKSVTIDACGCLCPLPLMMMVKQMKVPGCDAFEMLLDSETARDNVCRTAESRAWCIQQVVAAGGVWRVALARK
jgi:TusA-related sulfurtransferase